MAEVCGTDSTTYMNNCYLRQESCKFPEKKIRAKSIGKCVPDSQRDGTDLKSNYFLSIFSLSLLNDNDVLCYRYKGISLSVHFLGFVISTYQALIGLKSCPCPGLVRQGGGVALSVFYYETKVT